MATVDVSNQTQLNAAIAAATGGDVIQLASGNYNSGNQDVGAIHISNKTYGGSGLLFEADDPANPPVLQNRAIFLTAVNGVHFEDINCQGVGTTSNPNWPNWPSPSFSQGIRMQANGNNFNSDISFLRVLIQNYNYGMRLFDRIDDLVMDYCEWRKIGVDGIQASGGGDRWKFRRNLMVDPAIDGSRYTQSGRHPDWLQATCTDSTKQYIDMLIEENYFDTWMQKPFFLDDGTITTAQMIAAHGVSIRHLRPIIRRNYIKSSRTLTINLCDAKDAQVLDNTIDRGLPNPNNTETPVISIKWRSEAPIVTGNRMPAAIRLDERTSSVGAQTLNPNVIAESGWAAGGIVLTPGVNVGRAVGSAPAALTNEATHGRFGVNAYDPDPVDNLYNRVFVLPVTSPAFTDDPAKLRWRNPSRGINDYHEFKVASPIAVNAAGSRRFWPTSNNPQIDPRVPPGGTHVGMVVSYRTDTLWSDDSTYASNGDIAPSAPIPGDLAALTSGQWSIAVKQLAEGWFTGVIRTLSPFVDVESMLWRVPGKPWMSTLGLGLDGDGRQNWQMRGQDGSDISHLVHWNEVLPDIQVIYTRAGQQSLPSADVKSLTGPAPPTLLGGLTRGVLADLGADDMILAGRYSRLAPVGAPMPPENISYTDLGSSFTLQVVGPLPVGAQRLQVRYAGKAVRLQQVMTIVKDLPAHPFVYVRGIGKDAPGIDAWFPVT